uniref:Zinc metallopeptidase EGY3, chloroplastic n=1 Tax=Ananas comosus var. bracteatus TaxID=296719 RepID=A0A6V7QQI6_ANACO
MASSLLPSTLCALTTNPNPISVHPRIPFWNPNPRPFSLSSKAHRRNPRRRRSEAEAKKSETTVGGEGLDEKGKEQQEVDWKTDEEFKKFMGNPSIEAAIKLEKKRADRKLRELDRESDGNPITGFFRNVLRGRLSKEKEQLEKAEETFKALDLNKLRSCFGFDTFFAVDVRRFGDGGIFVGI